MAHEILPQHRPHEQLRTEAPAQRKHTDKYVSAYVSSDNYVDMSFSNPLLQESADHFRVGVDELTVNLAHLSLLEYDTSGTNVLFRIRRLGYFGDAATGQPADDVDANFGDVTLGLPTAAIADSVTFKITRQYNTLAEILQRAKEICRALTAFVKTTGLINPDPAAFDAGTYATWAKWNLPITQANAARGYDYVDVDLTTGGLLKFTGNKVFWSNFVIEIPEPKYRYSLLGDSTVEYISVNPSSAAIHTPYDAAGDVLAFDNWAATDTTDWDSPDAHLNDESTFRSFTGAMNVLFSLDRRVALELGCSLPVKNSPMFDHGKEAPDFVLGRFPLTHKFMNTSADVVQGVLSLDGRSGPEQLQGPKDRICYHHLGPQQKIQMLRLRLWARVRTYNATNSTWGMKTIQMPVHGSDFWHVRLHFTTK